MHAAASVLVSARVIAISVLMVEVIILSLFVLGPREGRRGVVGVAGVVGVNIKGCAECKYMQLM